MEQITLYQTIQYVAWFLAIAELILGLYLLVLNAQNSASRHAGTFLLLSSINAYAVGMMAPVVGAAQTELATIILALTTAAAGPLLLVTTIALLRPTWLQGKRRRLFWLAYAFIILPTLLTLVDLQYGTRLLYTGLDTSKYSGGDIISPIFTNGTFSGAVEAGFILSFILIIIFLFYVTLIDKRSSTKERKLAWILLLQLFLAAAILAYFAQYLLPSATILIINTLFVGTYAYAAFEQTTSSGGMYRGSLQSRLIAVVLIVTLPAIIALTAFISNRAQRLIEFSSYQYLSETNEKLQSAITIWLTSNERFLKQLAGQPSIISMDPVQHKPVLEQIVNSTPGTYLAGTVDLNGVEIYKSGNSLPGAIKDAEWFQRARSGDPITYQTTEITPSGTPGLISSVPIYDASGGISGVLYLANALDALGKTLGVSEDGVNTVAFVINANDQIVAHPELGSIDAITGMVDDPAVQFVRRGNLGPFKFTDNFGRLWRAKAGLLPNGWAIITQIPEEELNAPLQLFIRITRFTLLLVTLLLMIFTVLMIRQTLRPIKSLANITSAVAAGDLTQIAIVESDDELGILARSINSMTNQIRDLLSGLERRVTERTQDLEKRAVQLQVAAEVARESAAIRNLKLLLENTVSLISDRFDFYHAGIFLIDDHRTFAVLAAASSDGGHRMLAKGHRLKIGEVGIVGHVAASGEPRIALDVGSDATYFNNPDLPLTRSEIALPMKSQDQVIGILDVQSTKPAAFTDEDIKILQILANQIALAVENARLLQSSESSLRELEQHYRQQVSQAWEQRLYNKKIQYAFNRAGIQPAPIADFLDEINRADQAKSTDYQISVPIVLRGQTIGSLNLQREKDLTPWTPEDVEIIEATISQVALALESSRLRETEKHQMQKEQHLSQISARIQSALDIDTVMKLAVEEIGKSLNADRVQISLNANRPAKSASGNGSAGS